MVGKYCIGHNGNLMNGAELREEFSRRHDLKSTTDTEVMGLMLHEETDPFVGAENIFDKCEGSFNCVTMNNKGEVVLIRDPRAFQPFVWTDLMDNGKSHSASENIALSSIGIYDYEEIPPGEVIVYREDGSIDRKNFSTGEQLQKCPFEVLYFMRHGSEFEVNGERKVVVDIREEWGRMLESKYPIDADVRSYIPRSGMGYAMSEKLEDIFSVNPYSERIYMMPDRKGEKVSDALKLSRIEKSRLKNPPIVQKVRGKSIVILDDTIVRGNNAKAQIASLFEAGAKEISMLVAGAPVRYPCHLGKDHSVRRNLIAAKYPLKDANEAVAREITESCEVSPSKFNLGYLSLDEMLEPLGGEGDYCTACWTGEYPFKIPKSLKENMKLD